MAQNWDDNTYEPTHTAADDLQQIENNFACLKTCFSGSTAPTNPVDGMLWYETDTDQLKLYVNGGWMVLAYGAAGQVGNAATVDGYNASATPTANTLLPLDANGEYPASTIPGGTLNSFSLIAASGSWTVPSDVTKIWVTMCGGGGSGGCGSQGSSSGGGGGGSGYTIYRRLMGVTPGQVIAYTCGAGGTGYDVSSYPPQSKGHNGSETSFGDFYADGGVGGGNAYSSNGITQSGPGGAGGGRGGTAGTGGRCYSGPLKFKDYSGGSGVTGGGGAASLFGDGGDAPNNSNGQDGSGYGSGGGGGSAGRNKYPGDGAPGKIVIEYYT